MTGEDVLQNHYPQWGAKLVIECPNCDAKTQIIDINLFNEVVMNRARKLAMKIFQLRGVPLPVEEILRMAVVTGLAGLEEGLSTRLAKPKRKKKK